MDSALIILAAAVVAAAAILAFGRRPAIVAEPAAPPPPDPRLDTLLTKQGEIGGQFRATVAAQEALTRTLGERLEALEQRMGERLAATAQQTGETFVSITERLSVIDAAQKNISELSTHVVSLKAIFSDKQARGALAQDQMESIVSEHLAPDQFEFQAKLSNGKIVDCAIRIPNVAARIVVDAKFPHEGFEALRVADAEDARKAAMVQVRGDIAKHVRDISEKYLIPGETQIPAIMFVPSDSMYAEMHANFPETLKRARQAQVVLASPHVFMLVVTTLQGLMRDARMREQAQVVLASPHVFMLVITTLQGLMRDARMREQADMIRKEVGAMLNDVRLLGDRVEKLQRHFNQADGDIKDILVSRDKVVNRAEKIQKVEISASETPKQIG